MTTYYCVHCGKPRPVKEGYQPIDPRFSIVLCGPDDPTADPVEYPGHSDQAYVLGRLEAKKAKSLAKRKATLAAKAEAEAYARRPR